MMERSETDIQWGQWMELAQKGDQDAYKNLLSEILPYLRKYIASKLAKFPSEQEDLLQEAIMAIHTGRHTYLPNKNFTPWISAIVRYKVIDFYRSNKFHKMVPVAEVPEQIFDHTTPEDVDLIPALMKQLNRLPLAQREAIELTKLQGLSTEDAADKMGISPGALRVRIHRGYELLRELVNSEVGT